MPISSGDTIQQTAVQLPGECAPRLFLDVFAASDFLLERYGDLTVAAMREMGVDVRPIRMQISGSHDAG